MHPEVVISVSMETKLITFQMLARRFVWKSIYFDEIWYYHMFCVEIAVNACYMYVSIYMYIHLFHI